MSLKEIKKKIADLSNYGNVDAEDLKELADEINQSPQALEDIALAMGLNVEGLLED